MKRKEENVLIIKTIWAYDYGYHSNDLSLFCEMKSRLSEETQQIIDQFLKENSQCLKKRGMLLFAAQEKFLSHSPTEPTCKNIIKKYRNNPEIYEKHVAEIQIIPKMKNIKKPTIYDQIVLALTCKNEVSLQVHRYSTQTYPEYKKNVAKYSTIHSAIHAFQQVNFLEFITHFDKLENHDRKAVVHFIATLFL